MDSDQTQNFFPRLCRTEVAKENYQIVFVYGENEVQYLGRQDEKNTKDR